MTNIPLGQGPIHGAIGLLVLHPSDMANAFTEQWLQSLRESGQSVQTPFLHSIGEDWGKFTEEIWNTWIERTERALSELFLHCENVFLIGLGASGALGLRVAEKHGEKIDGIVLIDPTLPEDNKKLRKMRKELDEELYFVDQPLLLIYSAATDSELNPNAEAISGAVSSPLVREVALENPYEELSLVAGEIETFIGEVVHGFWNQDVAGDDSDLIDAEFQAIVAGLSLDESSPSNFLDDLDKPDPEDHFSAPDPVLAPIENRSRRNAIFAMVAGPVYAIGAGVTGFNPFGIEPWPGVIAAIGGLAYFFYSLQDGEPDDDGAIL